MLSQLLLHKDGIFKAFVETNMMVFYSMMICFIVSIPLGILLFSCNEATLYKNRIVYQILSISLNALRSVPFLIFIFVLIPINRFLFSTGFGMAAAILPLSLVSISIFSRFVEQALLNVKRDIILRALSMGASKLQMIYYFLLPSIIQDLVLSFTSVVISLVSYSTVMGVIGAGGLGDYAYLNGYQEYNYQLMYGLIIIFIVYVFVIQNIGYFIAKKVAK